MHTETSKSIEKLSEVVVFNKYAKYSPTKNRRETWEEIVDRYIQLLVKKYGSANDQLLLDEYPTITDKAFGYLTPLVQEILTNASFLKEKQVLMSMRMAQFAGPAVEKNHTRGYNCAFLPIDHPAAFSETMFLLLGGTGVGYSVQNTHIDKLPEIHKGTKDAKFLVGDSIEGWADAVKALMYWGFGKRKYKPRFDFSDIRAKGERLVTAGGKAPGPAPLRTCLAKLEGILENKENGSKLTSLEVHDILCHIADAVLAGGIRRAAMIALFSADDTAMITCKSGNWWETNPQRGRANNSAVLLRHRVTKEFFLKIWKQIENSNAGEPGVYFSNDSNWGTNPCCVAGDTWVLTTDGPRQVKDLVGTSFTSLLDGAEFNTESQGFWKTGTKEVFRVKTKSGFELRLTADHRLNKVVHHTRKVTRTAWTSLENLQVGDSVRLANHRGTTEWGGRGNYNEGWLLGSLVGDGTFSTEDRKSTRAHLDYWGPDSQEMGDYALSLVKDAVITRSDLQVNDQVQDTKKRVSSTALATLAGTFGITQGNKTVTELVEEGSYSFYQGFLCGLFDADGSVQGTQNKGVSVRLTQANLPLLIRVQRMLARLGIISTIYHNRLPEGVRDLPDGKGALAPYYCKEVFELVLAGNNLQEYAKVVGFREPAKAQKLDSLLGSYVRTPNQETFIDQIASITPEGEEEVYDVTIEKVHCFDASGIEAHNCEIALRSFSFCNLTEVNAGSIRETVLSRYEEYGDREELEQSLHFLPRQQSELNNRARVAAFFGTLQAGFTDFHYLRPIWRQTTEKDSLVGVGITGICNGDILPLNLVEAAHVAVAENKRVAASIGIAAAARVCTIKPSGTTSCVLGTSSGIHAWHSKYYIRNMQCAVGDDLYNFFASKHPELIQVMEYDAKSAVIGIPQRAPDTAILREDENAVQMLERVFRFYDEWVKPGHQTGANTNNVSATVYLKEEDWNTVGEMLWNNRNKFNGMSVLPYHGGTYKNAPFEECTEQQFLDKYQYLADVDLTQIVERQDNTTQAAELACSSGNCEI